MATVMFSLSVTISEISPLHVEEAVFWGKEMRAYTHKRDNFGIGVFIHEENLVQIGLIISEILHFMKCGLDLSFQVGLCDAFIFSSNSIIL